MIDLEQAKQELSAIRTQSKFYQYILEAIPKVVPEVHAWAILPFKAETKELVLLYENTRNYDFFESVKYLGYKEGFEGLAVLRKEPIYNDTFLQSLENHHIKSLHQPNPHCCAAWVQPLISGERIIGALALYFADVALDRPARSADLAKFCEIIARRMEEVLHAGYMDEQTKSFEKVLSNTDKIVENFASITNFTNWHAASEILLHSMRSVIDYSACGIFCYLPKESRIVLEAHVNINVKRFQQLETDIVHNPVIDIIVNHTTYLEEIDPGKLKNLGEYRSAIGIGISCPHGHDIALVLLHERSHRYNRYHFEYLKKFAHLFSIICLKREAETALEITQAKIMAGELTPMMIHEVRNLLNFSQGMAANYKEFFVVHSERLKQVIPDPRIVENQQKMIESMLDGQKNSRDILENYLEVTGHRKSSEQKEQLDINENVEKVFMLLRSEATDKGIHLKTELQNNLPALDIDSYKLQRILMNLVLNAIQCLSKGKVVTVSTRFDPNDRVRPFCIEVRDNGPGISARVMDRVFEPYFTTRKDGTGLGLAVCRQFVHSLGGSIQVDSAINRGATFILRFPYKGEAKHGSSK